MNIPLWIAAKSLQQWCHEIELTSTLLSYQHQIWLTCRYPDYLVLSTFCKSPSELRAPYEPQCPWHFQVCWHSSQAAVLAVWVPWHRSLIGGAVSTPLASAIRLNFCALLFCCYKLHIEFTLPLPFSRWWRHSSFAEWRMAGEYSSLHDSDNYAFPEIWIFPKPRFLVQPKEVWAVSCLELQHPFWTCRQTPSFIFMGSTSYFVRLAVKPLTTWL